MKKKIKKLFSECIKYVFIKYFSLKRIENEKIVIVNAYGNGYGDNSKYIVEELVKLKKYRIVWLVKKELLTQKHAFNEEVELVEYGSLLALKHLATSKVWLDSCRKEWHVSKRRGQFYIQLWHGSPALKKIEKDAGSSISKKYIFIAKRDSRNINIFISNCKWFTDKIRETFWYNGEILESGLPRNDIFFNQKGIKENVFNYLGLSENKNLLLYTPTFRKDQNLNAYDIDFNEIINVLELQTNQEWYVGIKLHPSMKEQVISTKTSNKILNLSNYPDVQELLVASDMLITDYSSTMFDFANTKKPVFLYCKDIEEYRKDRDLYFNLESLPFPISYSNSSLQESVKKFDYSLYLEKVNSFYDEIGYLEDGKATERIIKVINEITRVD